MKKIYLAALLAVTLLAGCTPYTGMRDPLIRWDKKLIPLEYWPARTYQPMAVAGRMCLAQN